MCKLLDNIIPNVCFAILFCNVANLTVKRSVGNHTAGLTNVLTQDILQWIWLTPNISFPGLSKLHLIAAQLSLLQRSSVVIGLSQGFSSLPQCYSCIALFPGLPRF